MNNRIITTESMTADHQTWLAAHAQWRQDIDRWQAEHRSAVARLAEMQKTVQEHGECLEEHAKAFRKFEDAIALHEREISKQFSGSNEQPQDVVANRHQEQEGVFSRQQDAHERIKNHHEGVMTRLHALEAAATAAL